MAFMNVLPSEFQLDVQIVIPGTDTVNQKVSLFGEMARCPTGFVVTETH
jgi:hypothetical protein